MVSDKQLKLYWFLRAFVTEHGHAPTLREAAHALGVAETSVLWRQRKLVGAGMLVLRGRYRRSRLMIPTCNCVGTPYKGRCPWCGAPWIEEDEDMISLQQRQRETAARVADFLQMNLEEVLQRIQWGTDRLAHDWRSRKPITAEDAKAFYAQENSDFLFDLLGWNATPMYQGMLDTLDTIKNSQVLVVGPGLGEEVVVLLEHRNRVLMLEIPDGILWRFQERRFAGTRAKHITWENFAWYRPTALDAVVAFDSLEHVHNGEILNCLRTLHLMLRPGGSLHVHVTRSTRDMPQHYDHAVAAVEAWLEESFDPTESEYVWLRK